MLDQFFFFLREEATDEFSLYVCSIKKCFIVSGRSFFSELVLTYALNCKLRCTKFKITFRVSRPRFVDGAKHIFRVASIDLLAKCTRYSTERQLEQSFKLPLYDFCCYKLLGSSPAQNLNKKVWLFYQLAYLYTAACKGNTESKLYWVIRLQPSSSTLWHPRRNQQTLSSIVFSYIRKTRNLSLFNCSLAYLSKFTLKIIEEKVNIYLNGKNKCWFNLARIMQKMRKV